MKAAVADLLGRLSAGKPTGPPRKRCLRCGAKRRRKLICKRFKVKR